MGNPMWVIFCISNHHIWVQSQITLNQVVFFQNMISEGKSTFWGAPINLNKYMYPGGAKLLAGEGGGGGGAECSPPESPKKPC